MVRWCRRCASSTLPSRSSSARRTSSSSLIVTTASFSRSRPVTKCDFGYTAVRSWRLQRLAGDRIERRQLVDLVAEQPDAKRELFVRRIDLDDVAAHAEVAARELVVVALVLDLHQLAQDLIAIDALPFLERQHQPVVRLRRAQAVDARHAGDDDDVAALEERSGGRQPHAIDLVVDRSIPSRCRCRSPARRLRAGSSRSS